MGDNTPIFTNFQNQLLAIALSDQKEVARLFQLGFGQYRGQVLNLVNWLTELTALRYYNFQDFQQSPARVITSVPYRFDVPWQFESPELSTVIRGAVDLATQGALIRESASGQSGLRVQFEVPVGVSSLQFDLHTALAAAASGGPRDAFEVALRDRDTGAALTAVQTLSFSDALLNLQVDGSSYLAQGVSMQPLAGTGATRSSTVQIDLTSAAPGQRLELFFDLLGFGALDSQVQIDNVRLIAAQGAAPLASADQLAVLEDTALRIDATNLLSNDTNSSGSALTIEITDAPDHGVLTPDGLGAWVYVPTPNFNGTDTFAYRVSDGVLQSTAAQVTIEVVPVNDAPLLQPVASRAVQAGSLVQVQLSATDPDGDSVRYILEVLAPGAVVNDSGLLLWQTPSRSMTAQFAVRAIDPSGASSTVSRFTIEAGSIIPIDPAAPGSGTNQGGTGPSNPSNPSVPAVPVAVPISPVAGGSSSSPLQVPTPNPAVQMATALSGVTAAESVLSALLSAGSPIRVGGYDTGRLPGVPATALSASLIGTAGFYDFASGLSLGSVSQSSHDLPRALGFVRSDAAPPLSEAALLREVHRDAAPDRSTAASSMLQVAWIQVTDRGLRVRFNQAIDPARLTASAIRVTQGGLPIEGRVIVNADGDGFFFEPAAGRFDTAGYAIRLLAQGGAFVTPQGQLLDGDYDGQAGGDYVGQFVVTPTGSTAAVEHDAQQTAADGGWHSPVSSESPDVTVLQAGLLHGGLGGALSLTLGGVLRGPARRVRARRAMDADAVRIEEKASASDDLCFPVQAPAGASRLRSEQPANPWQIRL
jgi:hypothetical protein